MLDGDTTTGWSSWGELEHALRRWYDPEPFLDRWWKFLDAQPVRVEIDLGTTDSLTAIVLALGSTDPLAVPRLVIETSTDGTTWSPLPGELDPLPDARALVRHPAEPRFALRMDAPLRARWLRLSSKGFETHVTELEAYAEERRLSIDPP